jgi:fibronectin-binding autotransporter adhesin
MAAPLSCQHNERGITDSKRGQLVFLFYKGHQAMSSSFLFSNRAIQYNLFAIALALSSIGRVLAADGTWIDSDGDGLWSDTANWSGGVVADGSGSTANFNTVDANPATVNTNFPGFYRNAIGLDTSRTIGNIIFGDSDTSTPGGWEVYIPTGTPVLTLAGTTPTITVNPLGPYVAPTETIDDAIIRTSIAGTQGLTKAGNGVLTLTGAANTITGGTNITAGTLRQRSVINGQVITIGNGAMLDTNQSLRNVAVPTGGAVHSIVVASGNTATIRSSSNLGNISASGANLNIQIPNNSTLTASDNWAVNGSPATVNVTGLSTNSPSNSNFRISANGAAYSGASLQNSAVNLDNVIAWTRTNSTGNTISFGSLSGTSTAILSGGGQGGGTVATYSIGALNTNTEFAGTIDSTSAPAGNTLTNLGGINLLKVGSGTLTLSGTLSYQTDLNGTVNRRGGVATVSAGILALKNGAQFPAGISGQNTIVNVLTGATLDVSLSTLTGGYNSSPLQTTLGIGTIAGTYVHDDGVLSPGDTIAGATGTTPTPTPASAAGTLTFGNNLSFNQAATSGAGGTIKFDISPSTVSGNDLIQVNGVTTLTGSPTLSPSFLGGFTTGTYTIINSNGGFNGNASGWTVAWPGRGTAPTLSVNGNQLLMTVGAGSTGNVNWTGTADSIWVSGSGGPLNWWNNNTNAADRTFDLDTVNFADTYGPSNTAVTNSAITLNTTVTPVAINVNNSAVNYSITGSGSITGGSGLTKTGTGTLTIGLTVAQTFTGPVSISGGGIINTGTTVSGLGTGALTMNGGKVIAALGGSIANSGITIGPGTNSIEINGTNATAFGIPAMTGSGTAVTVTTTAQSTLVDISGISAFNGTLTISPDGVLSTAMNARFNGAGSGNANTAVVLANGAQIRDRATSVQTIQLGSLAGDSTSGVGGFQGGSTATVKTWQIGALNTSTTFAGTITNGGGRSGGVDTVAAVALTKVGTGTLTLTGNNNYGGATTVNGGTLLVNGTHVQDLSPTTLPTTGLPPFNPGDYAVNSGGTLGGTGTIGDGLDPLLISVNAGGTLAPGAGGIGTLSAIANVTFADTTSIFKVEANGTSNTSDLFAVTGDLTLNGASLMASLLSGTTPSGPYTIATYTGILSGTFTAPAGISVDYSTLGQIKMTINSLGTPGDYNGDTKINVADYVTWRKNPGGNGNDPGYVTWRENFNTSQSAGAGLSGASVPEPATWMLALLVAALAFRRADRK